MLTYKPSHPCFLLVQVLCDIAIFDAYVGRPQEQKSYLQSIKRDYITHWLWLR